MPSRRQRRTISQKKASSRQPSRARKWFLRSLLLLSVLLIAGIIFAYSSLRSYLKGDDFNALIAQKISHLLHADLTLDPLQWDGWQVKSASLSGAGKRTLQSLTAQSLDTEIDLSGLRQKTWLLSTLSIREAHLDLTSSPAVAPDSKPPSPSPKKKSAPRFFDSWMPNQTKLDALRIGKLSGNWDHNSNLYSWKRLSLTATPAPGATSQASSYDLVLKSGHLTTPLPLLPKAKLLQATARINPVNNTYDLFLKDAQLDVLDHGQLTLSGEKTATGYALEGELTGVKAAEVLPQKWTRHLAGDLHTDFELSGKSDAPATLAGHLTLTNGVLSQLPFLDRMAAYADTTRFRHLNLSTAELDYEKQGDHIAIRNLNLTSEGLVRLTGKIDLVGKKIDARLRLGLTPGTLANIPGAETKIFLPGTDNLLWTNIHLTGTLDDLNEDLSDRLVAAAFERMFELAPETGLYVLKNSGRLAGESAQALLKESGKLASEISQKATQLAPVVLEKGIDTATKAGETATDAAKKAVELGNGLFKGLLSPAQ